MELRHVRYLLAVAEHGNFTRAAEALHISQPTLSQQIKQLERLLGAQMLDRTGRTVRLTDAGRVYTEHARNALRDLEAGERAMHDVRDLRRGHLRVAMTPTITAYLIGPLIDRFHRAHPGITVALTETTQDRLEEDLLADTVDVGIAFSGTHAPGIDATALGTESLSLVVGADHALAGRSAPLPVGQLADEPLALLRPDFATRAHIDAYLADRGLAPRVALEANSISALIEVTRCGALGTVLPDAIARAHPDLRPVPLDPVVPRRTMELLRRASAYHSAAARAFVATACDDAAEIT
ncbi:transcriptional regulator CynR [Nocardia sp. AG03]|uniref:transcriptional regulator CynR n=1 Tax=Nocardia sp. AG03 TaxID=3025312 RepID=UPI002418A5BD|nr:transcriptional regulator CynR [Nocardia sp. AG03]